MPTKTLSLLALFLGTALFVGCGGAEEGSTVTPGQEVETHSEPDAPHGGHVLHGEPHGAVHLEVTFDTASREVAIYPIVVKDGKWEAYSVDQETIEFHYHAENSDDEAELEFAVVADADPKGSKFVLAGDALPAEIKSEEQLHGHVHLTVDGKEHVFEMHHDHGHGHDHHHGEGGHDHGEHGEEEHADETETETETEE